LCRDGGLGLKIRENEKKISVKKERKTMP